jgi:hypothetical protein
MPLMAVRREVRHINYRMHAIGKTGTSSKALSKLWLSGGDSLDAHASPVREGSTAFCRGA